MDSQASQPACIQQECYVAWDTRNAELWFLMQTAINIVLAYPYYPDISMLVDLIAAETPGEQTASEILGTDTLPPR